MPRNDIFVGDEGTSFGGTVKDQDEAVIDISAATVKTIRFTDPSGVSVDKTAAFVTDGTDGMIHYISDAAFIDEAGIWFYQGYIELPLGKWYTDIHSFEVEAVLVAP